MAAAVLSHVTKNANGTIDIPYETSMVVALIKGSNEAPIFNGVQMVPVGTLPAVSPVEAIGVFFYRCAFWGNGIPFIHTGSRFTIDFYCLSDVSQIRSTFSGYSETGVLSGSLPSNTDDIILGIMALSEGPAEMQGDGVNFALVNDSALHKVGSLDPADSSVEVEANDLGTSNGYPVREYVTIPGELISPERRETIATYHPGVYVLLGSGLDEYWVWQPPYTTYTVKIYPAVYGETRTVTYDRWVDDGVSGKVNAIFCSLMGDDIDEDLIFSPILS